MATTEKLDIGGLEALLDEQDDDWDQANAGLRGTLAALRERAGGVGWLLMGAGAVAILATYLQVRPEPDPSLQIPYVVSGGLLGLLLALAGAVVVLLRTLLPLAARLERVEDALRSLETNANVSQDGSPEAKGRIA